MEKDIQNSVRIKFFIGAWLLLWVLVFWLPLSSVVGVWWLNDTFNHCFFVLPGAAYIIWKQQGEIFSSRPSVSYFGGLLVLAVLFIFLIGKSAYIDVFQHAGAFALLPATALFLFGWQVCLKIWFPLLFVLFSIPVGQELVPFLQDITAEISLYVLTVFSIPVFKDGLYISIPNGNFFVAEACSGISFFIACLVIGAAYAYLNFRSYKRAIIFLLITLLLPIVANGLRVFGIIYIGHTVGIEYASGADHIIYGGVFFAVMIIALLVIGNFMSDGIRIWPDDSGRVDSDWNNYTGIKYTLIALLPLLIVGFFMISTKEGTNADTFLFESGSSWRVVSEAEANDLNWTPRFKDADQYELYESLSDDVKVYRSIYQVNAEGKELIHSKNRLFDLEGWSLDNSRVIRVSQLGEIKLLELTSLSGQRRILAYWYVVNGLTTSNHYLAKLRQALNSLTKNPSGGALYAVSFPDSGADKNNLTSVKETLSDLAQTIQKGMAFSE